MAHYWHNLCGKCFTKSAPSGHPFCHDCDPEVDAELEEILKEGDK